MNWLWLTGFVVGIVAGFLGFWAARGALRRWRVHQDRKIVQELKKRFAIRGLRPGPDLFCIHGDQLSDEEERAFIREVSRSIHETQQPRRKRRAPETRFTSFMIP